MGETSREPPAARSVTVITPIAVVVAGVRRLVITSSAVERGSPEETVLTPESGSVLDEERRQRLGSCSATPCRTNRDTPVAES
jgi:hypothetical protein